MKSHLLLISNFITIYANKRPFLFWETGVKKTRHTE